MKKMHQFYLSMGINHSPRLITLILLGDPIVFSVYLIFQTKINLV